MNKQQLYNKAEIKRLASSAGVKRVGGEVYETLNQILRKHLDKILLDVTRYMKYSKNNTIHLNAVTDAIRDNRQETFEDFTSMPPLSRVLRTTKNKTLTALSPFKRYVKDVTGYERISANAIKELKTYMENYSIFLIETVYRISIFSKRVTLKDRDFNLLSNIC